MTDGKSYEEGRKEISKVFEVKKDLLRKLGMSYENVMNTALLPQVKSIGSLGVVTTNEFVYVYDCFEMMFLSLSEAVQKIERRIEQLETAKEMVSKINLDEIASVAKFAQDFNKQVEESRKKMEEYKSKMKENDLAT
jgi:DNA repair exonuclease SbcCD ATPase subunit